MYEVTTDGISHWGSCTFQLSPKVLTSEEHKEKQTNVIMHWKQVHVCFSVTYCKKNAHTSSRLYHTVDQIYYSYSRCVVGCSGFVDRECQAKHKTVISTVCWWMTDKWITHSLQHYRCQHQPFAWMLIIPIIIEILSYLVCGLQGERGLVTLLYVPSSHSTQTVSLVRVAARKNHMWNHFIC